MPVTMKTGRIRDRLAAGSACAFSILVVVLGSLSLGAAAADSPAASSAPSSAPSSGPSAKAKALAAQVEAALEAADAPASGTPAPPPAAPRTFAPSAAGPTVPAAANTAPSGIAPPGAADTRSLDESTQQLKKDVVDLNRDLFVLEEELLFPANTQVAVYVSMDVGEFFALDSVTLKIDNKEVTNYLYTPREVDALLKGGVQRLYLGNLKVGNHELVAFFNGKGPDNRDYRRGASLKFDKSIGAKYLELKIEDRQRKMQPEFEIKDWE
jgi:hypothetical protein